MQPGPSIFDKENMGMKTCNIKKPLHSLQPAAVAGKENLVGGRRTLSENMKSIETAEKPFVPKEIVAADLTAEEPSEKYWQTLAEQRRIALDEALKENRVLYEKVKLLEDECKCLQEILKDTTDIVEYVKDVIEEKEGKCDNLDDTGIDSSDLRMDPYHDESSVEPELNLDDTGIETHNQTEPYCNQSTSIPDVNWNDTEIEHSKNTSQY